MGPVLFNIVETAEMMKMSTWKVRQLVQEKRLRCVRLLKGKMLFTAAAIQDAIRQAETPAR